jgi:hypothetical protein
MPPRCPAIAPRGTRPASARREASLGELRLDQPQPGPHDVHFLAAVGVLLAPVRAPQAVVVARALEKLGEGVGFVAGEVERNRDNF